MSILCVQAGTPGTHTFQVRQQATLLAVIRHCITDIWNLLTYLQFPVNAATLEASYT